MVNYKPSGDSDITPYLVVKDGAKALQFYEQIFGAAVTFRMDKPDGSIGHAELKFGDSKVMLATEYPDMQAFSPLALGGTPVTLCFYVRDVDATVNRAVQNGAKLLKAVENMFYGDRAGVIEDPFGHRWCIATHVEDVDLEELKKRAAQQGCG